MLVQNNTHYHNVHTRLYNDVPDPTSFSFESSRRNGYFQRLYYEYLYTQKINGNTFFWTLTYNDNNIPKYLGRACFSYKDIRIVTNGVLSKELARKYGSRLRYLCACERGEGKGSRGLGNNPHYHFIFFVQPIHDKNNKPDYSNYKSISSYEFADLINQVWQGTKRRIDWRFARFGHAQPGNDNGLVTSPDAFKYCAKYVCKDVSDISLEGFIRQYYETEFRLAPDSFKFYHYYKFLLQTDLSISDKSDFIDYFQLLVYNRWRHSTTQLDKSYKQFCESTFLPVKGAYYTMLKWYNEYFRDNYINDKINEYRREFSGKVRCSKSLGLYGLDFIKFNSDYTLTLQTSTSSGYECRPPCLYYVRKLFYNIKRCPVTGSVLYYLNEKGIDFKLKRLEFDIDRQVSKLLIDYDNFKLSFKSKFEGALTDFELTPELAFRYVVFNTVYRYRFTDECFDIKVDSRLRLDDIISDYRSFLTDNCSVLDFDNNVVYNRYISYDTLLTPMSELPFFSCYKVEFNYLDSFFTFMKSYQDSCKKQSFKESFEHQRRLKSLNYNLR